MTRVQIPANTKYGDLLAYSRLVALGDEAWIAGCAPTDDSGELVGRACPHKQTRQCIANIERALTDAGFVLADVVRTRLFIRSFEHAEQIMRAHREAFDSIRPASTVIAVADLVLPEMLIYMDADARRAR
ncbi:MAG: Rid family hydrolase [Hyphomonadaceae bacterium]|nr:Rid family hydrolase [Hyphomonadaceae bacterium]